MKKKYLLELILGLLIASPIIEKIIQPQIPNSILLTSIFFILDLIGIAIITDGIIRIFTNKNLFKILGK